MDANKLKVLREIDYVIPRTCGTCQYGEFPSPTNFGTCAVRTYEHAKHTGALRQLSVYSGGGCPDLYQLGDTTKAELGEHWLEFVEKREFTRPNRGKLVSKKVRY